MNSESVCIIIPAYNVADYLPDCLNSIYRQNLHDFIIVCVDDGSTDNTPVLLAEFAKDRHEFHMIRQNNQGLSAARNTGIDFALDKLDPSFIFFLDGDDVLDDGYIGRLVHHALCEKNDIVCGSFSFFDGKIRRPFIGNKQVVGEHSAPEATRLLVADESIQSHAWGKLYKTDLWKILRFPPQIYYMEDQATVFQAFAHAQRISILDDCGYLYRQRDASLVRSKMTNEKVLCALEAYITPCIYPFPFEEAERELVKHAALQAFSRCYLMMYSYSKPRTFSPSENLRWRKVKRFVRKEKCICSFMPHSPREKMKKLVYLFLRPFYRAAYRYASGANRG